jgi:hypothetical protein
MVAFEKPLSFRPPLAQSHLQLLSVASQQGAQTDACRGVRSYSRNDGGRALWKAHTYVYLDATQDLKVRWGASVTSMALLACVGVDEEGGIHLDGLRRPRRDQGGSRAVWSG